MITHEDLKSKVEKSGWPSETIAAVEAVFPNIGPLTLNYLHTNFENIGEPDLLTQFPIWRKEVENGDSDVFPTALAEVLEQGNRTYMELMSCFIYDIHSNNVLASKVGPELNRKLFIYQFAVLEEVPSKEVVWALMYNAADLAMVVDLESELKRYCYYKNYPLDSKDTLKFREALEHCDQELTQQSIPMVNGNVPGTVKNFIKDFREFVSSLPARSASYAVANYVTGASAMKLLNPAGVSVLQRILEVYAWCLEGAYTEREIKVYETEREEVLEILPDIISGVEPIFNPNRLTPRAAPRTAPPITPQAPQRFVRELNPQRVDHVTPLPNPIAVDSLGTVAAPIPKPKPTPIIEKPASPLQSVAPKPAPLKPPVSGPLGIRHQPSELTSSTRVKDLIKPAAPPRGVIRDNTNIRIGEEQKRFLREQAAKAAKIQQKLLELRNRNKTETK